MGNWNLHETLVVTRMPLRKPTRLKIDGCALIYRVPQLTKFLVDEQTPERRVTGEQWRAICGGRGSPTRSGAAKILKRQLRDEHAGIFG